MYHRAPERRKTAMDRLTHDTRMALRSLRRSPLFTTAAVLILAVGIGMAGAMYSVIDGVMLRSLPVRDQDRIVVLHARDRDGVDLSLAGQDFEDLRHDSRLVQNIAGVYHAGAFVMPLTMDGRPVILKEAIVTGNFFQLLGVSPVLGRLLRPADDTLGGLQSIVLSYGTWRRQFAGDTAILGRHFRSPYETPPYKSGFTIIGVAPPGLDFPVGADFWADAGYPDNWQMDAVGRLATAAAPGAARSEFLGLMQQLGRRQTVSVDVETADIHTLLEAITGEAKPVLIVVSAAVVFLLIISCVNVGNLLLVRGAIRSPELVLRRAIGGTSRDLARLLSLESTLLVVAGGVLGLVLAQVLEALLFALAPGELPRTDVVRLAGTPIAVITCIVVDRRGALRGRVLVRRQPMGRVASTVGRRALRRAHAATPASGSHPGRSPDGAGVDHARWRGPARPNTLPAAARATGLSRGSTLDLDRGLPRDDVRLAPEASPACRRILPPDPCDPRCNRTHAHHRSGICGRASVDRPVGGRG